MDDQQQDKQANAADETRDAAAEMPQAGMADAQGAASPSGDDTPDAIKAAGEQPIAGEADAGAPDDPLSPDAINDPSMNLPEPNSAVAEAVGSPTPGPEAHPAEFPQFGNQDAAKVPRNINLLMDVKLPVSIELGRTTLPISEILEWGQGSIIELDRLAGEAVDLMVNNKLVAKGEVVVVDEKFGLRITSLISPRERLETL